MYFILQAIHASQLVISLQIEQNTGAIDINRIPSKIWFSVTINYFVNLKVLNVFAYLPCCCS